MTYEECEKTIRPLLSEKRFYHSQCVAREAVKLAKRFGADEEKARLSGILHDIMKDTPPAEQLKILSRFGIIMDDSIRRNKKLWHAFTGAAYLEHELGIADREILDAVRYHTSGRKDMTLLDKVIFVADYNSADRDYPDVKKMRKLAEKSLEEAIAMGVAFTLEELTRARFYVSADSVEAYNDAINILEREKEKNR